MFDLFLIVALAFAPVQPQSESLIRFTYLIGDEAKAKKLITELDALAEVADLGRPGLDGGTLVLELKRTLSPLLSRPPTDPT